MQTKPTKEQADDTKTLVEALGGRASWQRTRRPGQPYEEVFSIQLQEATDHDKPSNMGTLNLASTKVTDAGMGNIAKLKNLRHLYLWDTQVTKAGLSELQMALPHCQIEHSL